MNKDDLNSKLKENTLYNELVQRSEFSVTVRSAIELIQDVGVYSTELAKSIIINMPEFTLHDENHIFNMLYLSQKLIPEDSLKRLSSADIMMLILSIFLHDIGMAPPRELIKAWKGQLNEVEQKQYETEILMFNRFRKTCIREIEDINRYNIKEEYSKAQLLEDQIITEYIRKNHADRARKMISDDWSEKIKYGHTDLTAELAEICFSHNESNMALLEMETIKLCDENTIICLPFIGIILRLTDIIDFDSKRTPAVLFSHLTIKNPVSLKEWIKHISINAWSFSNDSIMFSAHCSHPAIEATIRSFCDLIDNELRNCTFVLANLHSDICDLNPYKIKLPAYVNRAKIGAKKDIISGKSLYSYHETKFTLSKKQVVDLLMGTQLYGKPEFALRELIQNSIDACLLRKQLSRYWGEEYTPHICATLKTIKEEEYLIVEDNGIGMNQHIVDNYYTNLGRSYYVSTEFLDLVAETGKSFKPISRFGIGILSCFMVCDCMEVETKRLIAPYQSDEALELSVDGYDSLFVIKPGTRKTPGTKTILKLRESHPWSNMKKGDFVKCISNLIPLPPFNIDIMADDDMGKCSPEAFEELELYLDEDYSWNNENSIFKLEIDLNDYQKGFRGKAEIAFIVNSNDELIDRLNIYEKEIVINDEVYSFSSDISYSINCIRKSSTNVDVDEEGDINIGDSFRHIALSDAALSVHGIDIPVKLFRNYREKAVLNLPFPIRFRLDIGLENDLNLNASRTQIIYDDIWLDFEKQFYELVCKKIKNKVGFNKWKLIKKIFAKNPDCKTFCEILVKM